MLLISFVSYADFKVALCKSRIFPIKAILKHKQVACYPGCQRVYFFGSEAAIVHGITAHNHGFAMEKKPSGTQGSSLYENFELYLCMVKNSSGTQIPKNV